MGQMTYSLLVITLLVLLAALFRVKFLKFQIAREVEETDKCFARWRHTNHQLEAMTTKATKLIGEKANAESRIRQLESELRRKHRRVRL